MATGAAVVARSSRGWSPKGITVLYAALYALAAFLYFFRVGALSFVVDEIYHGVVSRSILENGLPDMPNGSLYLKGVLFSYAGAAGTWLLGSSEAGVRSVSGICMLSTGWCVARIARLYVGQRLTLLAVAMWLLHPWVIEFARWGRLYSLATLLLSAAVAAVLTYDRYGRRRDLLGAWLFLGISTLVYPMGIFAAFGFVWLFVHRAYNRLSPASQRRLTGLILGGAFAGAFLGLGLWVLSFEVPELELRSWAVVFSGATGNEGPSVARFLGFSGFYLGFLFHDLPVLATAGVLLATVTWFKRRDPAFVRPRVLLLVLSLGAAVFVTFVHLQTSTPRYLFPSLPFLVLSTVLLLGDGLQRLSLIRRNQLEILAFAVLGIGVATSGVFKIPFRHHGAWYPNPNFGPSPHWTRHFDFRESAELVRQEAKKWDLIVASQETFFYHYAGVEANYVFSPRRRSEGRPVAPYLRRTREVTSCEDLKLILLRQRYRTAWLNLWSDRKTNACMEEIREIRPFKLVYTDGLRKGIRVYRLPSVW